MSRGVEVVEEQFKFPFALHNYQKETVKEAAEDKAVLLSDKVGLGKTAIATYLGLYHSVENGVEQILALTPPSLIDQFDEWIRSIEGVGAPLVYRGTPLERKAMNLEGSPVVVMSYNIFRSDYDRVYKMSLKHKLFILADELSLKSMRKTYKNLKTLMYRRLRLAFGAKPYHYLCALNATPISDRKQIYNWCSIFIPDAYQTLALFMLAHAGDTDNWGNVLTWRGTHIMDQTFSEFAVTSKNVELELPESVYTEIPYSLEKKHAALYRDIAEAEFAMLPDRLILNAVEALFSTLQRVVLTPKDYGLDIRSPILDYIDRYLDQLNEDDKIVLYTRHVSVSKMLQEQYPNAVAYFGSVSKKDKTEGLAAFKTGEAQIMIANLDSLGKGQNLQMANHEIFVELPFRSDVLTQVCGRIARQGQKKTCFFNFPLAKGTIQRQIYRRLLDNDADLLKFNQSKAALRDFMKSV